MDLKKFSGKKICVAVSGGQDSVALLHYLKTKENECGYSLIAVHCEHGIRGEESVLDAEFVVKFCRDLGVECIVKTENCPEKARLEKTSLETASRDFRQDVFLEILATGRADYVATAHHQDDEAETVLFRLARGTLSGAKGIEEENGRFIRPFLRWAKTEIVEYVEKNKLPYREDRTNFVPDVTRNKIRLEILPKLNEAVGGASENLAKFAFRLAEDDELLQTLAKALLSVDEGGKTTVAFSDKKPLFARALIMAIKGLGVYKDYTSAHLDAVYGLQNSERGAKLDLPYGLQAEKTEKGIALFIKKEEKPFKKPEEMPFSENGFDGGRYEITVQKTPPVYADKVLVIDGDKLPKDATFRFRKEGDKIRRFGGGTKSLKKFFNEEKTPLDQREQLPLIAQKDGSTVYVVCGVEISEDVKISKTTRNALYIITKEKET